MTYLQLGNVSFVYTYFSCILCGKVLSTKNKKRIIKHDIKTELEAVRVSLKKTV